MEEIEVGIEGEALPESVRPKSAKNLDVSFFFFCCWFSHQENMAQKANTCTVRHGLKLCSPVAAASLCIRFIPLQRRRLSTRRRTSARKYPERITPDSA